MKFRLATCNPVDPETLPVFRKGSLVRVDLFHCGFIPGKVLEVIEPGSGMYATEGKIRVQLTADGNGYKCGEIVVKSCTAVVPLKHCIKKQFSMKINPYYRWST